jgi:hypothetical protein
MVGGKTMTLINAFLTLVAILISVLTIGLLIMWWRGVDSIAFPGLGLLIATPVLVLLLLIIEVVVVFIAMLAKSVGASA